MDIFEDLYFGQYHVALPDSEKFRELQKQEVAFWDYIEKSVGEEYLAAHFDHRAQREGMIELHCFREGFRLGASLLLERL